MIVLFDKKYFLLNNFKFKFYSRLWVIFPLEDDIWMECVWLAINYIHTTQYHTISEKLFKITRKKKKKILIIEIQKHRKTTQPEVMFFLWQRFDFNFRI